MIITSTPDWPNLRRFTYGGFWKVHTTEVAQKFGLLFPLYKSCTNCFGQKVGSDTFLAIFVLRARLVTLMQRQDSI
jgi:hypothetical protein